MFDVDSIGLIRVLNQLNSGVDSAGASIGRQASFSVACAVDPTKQDQQEEARRLHAKLDAGAHWVMTQPIENQLNVFGTYTTNQEGYPMFLDYRIQASCYSFNTHSSCDQIIFTVPEEQAFWEPVYLLWEGDLNQDGWPDFILMDNQSDFSGTYNLYLGQAPEAGKVVRKVASFEEWDRC